MPRSFASRLALAFAAVGAAGAVVTALFVNVAFGGLLGGYLGQQQQARQQQIVSQLAASYADNRGWSPAALDRLAPTFLMQGAQVTVENAAGEHVWDTASSRPTGMMGGPGMQQMMGGGGLGPAESFPVTVDGAPVGTAVIQLPASGTAAVDVSFRNAVNRVLVLGGITAGLLAALLGLLLARRATEPVRQLTGAAGALAAGERERRVPVAADAEFGAMARAFNSMADAIGEEDRLRRTFAADVAHELRTPLMILSSQLEALEDGLIAAGPDAIRSLQEETQRITRLVSDLEVLASVEAAHFTLERRPLDLEPVLSAAAAEFAPLFAERRVTFERSLQPADVEGDAGRLRQVVGNLLSNALKFTPAGGRVGLVLTSEGGAAVVRVEDSGPGIAPDEVPHVFERFFRGRGARAGGSGIGLTVVRELVAAHGGSVEVANRPAGGAEFTVRLPLRGEPSARIPPLPREQAVEPARIPPLAGRPRSLS